MSDAPPPQQHVFRHRSATAGFPDTLILLCPSNWQQIVRGTRPFDGHQHTPGQERLLVILSRSHRCERIDAIKVQTDQYGFLLTLDATLAPLPDSVVDLRGQLIRRYLQRRHVWQPNPSLIDQALSHAGVQALVDGR